MIFALSYQWQLLFKFIISGLTRLGLLGKNFVLRPEYTCVLVWLFVPIVFAISSIAAKSIHNETVTRLQNISLTDRGPQNALMILGSSTVQRSLTIKYACFFNKTRMHPVGCIPHARH